MAEVFVQNLRYPDQMIGIMVTITKMLISEVGPHAVWLLEASTKEMDQNGNYIPPARKYLSDQTTITDDVNDIIDQICTQINWQYEADTEPPQLQNTWPPDGSTDISVETDIYINISENIPSSGLDLSSIKVWVKGFDVTDQLSIKGGLSNCSIKFTPGTKYQSAVNEDFNNGS